MKKIIILAIVTSFISLKLSAFTYENPADYQLMGDWTGKWIDAKKGHEAVHTNLAAKLIPITGGKYRVVILPELYNRSKPYLVTEVSATHDRVAIDEDNWNVVFQGNQIKAQSSHRDKLKN